MTKARTALHPRLIKTVSLDIPSIAANTVTDATFTIKGLTTDMVVLVNPTAALPAGLVMSEAHVSAKNTLSIRFHNTTASAINPPPMNFFVVAF